MSNPPDPDPSFLEEALARYVSIPSVNPAFSKDSDGEEALARVVAHDLADAGLSVQTLSAGKGRDSVVGRLRGKGGGRSLMLYAHLDTVGPGGMDAPFTPRLSEQRLYGRGAYDMKAGLASCVAAARQIASEGALSGDLFVVAVADEEEASLGIQRVLEHIRTDAAIVTEPTELEVCVAHKGFVWFEIEVHGRAAHGSRFEEGLDANLMAGRALAALASMEVELRTGPRHPMLGPGSMHVGTLRGGSALSVYADRCRIGVERRTLPGEETSHILQEVENLLDRLSETDDRFRASARLLLAREPFEAPSDSAITSTLSVTATRELGRVPAVQGATYWMDAAFTSAAGIDTVVFGPSGQGAHADVEWVDLKSVRHHCAILAGTARTYCDR